MTVAATTGLVEAAQVLRSRHVGFLVVTGDGAPNGIPIGVLTDRDIVLELAPHRAEGIAQRDVGVLVRVQRAMLADPPLHGRRRLHAAEGDLQWQPHWRAPLRKQRFSLHDHAPQGPSCRQYALAAATAMQAAEAQVALCAAAGPAGLAAT